MNPDTILRWGGGGGGGGPRLRQKIEGKEGEGESFTLQDSGQGNSSDS